MTWNYEGWLAMLKRTERKSPMSQVLDPEMGSEYFDLWRDAEKEITKLKARIAELETALGAVVKWVDDLGYYAEPGTELAPVFHIAKAALKDKP